MALEIAYFFGAKITGIPEYLFNIIPQTNQLRNTCLSEDVATFYSRTDVFKYSFFSICNIIMEQT